MGLQVLLPLVLGEGEVAVFVDLRKDLVHLGHSAQLLGLNHGLHELGELGSLCVSKQPLTEGVLILAISLSESKLHVLLSQLLREASSEVDNVLLTLLIRKSKEIYLLVVDVHVDLRPSVSLVLKD